MNNSKTIVIDMDEMEWNRRVREEMEAKPTEGSPSHQLVRAMNAIGKRLTAELRESHALAVVEKGIAEMEAAEG